MAKGIVNVNGLGGSSGSLIVTFSPEDNGYVANHSHAEIMAANVNGTPVFAHCPSIGVYNIPLVFANVQTDIFSMAFNKQGTYTIFTFVIMADETVNVFSEEFQGKDHTHGAGDITEGTLPVVRGGTGVTSLDALKESLGVAIVYEASIGTSWTEDEDTGVKSQTVSISGITADNTAKVDHRYNGNGTSDGYAQFVEEENQFLSCITNGYAETVAGGIKFYIFGDAPTIAIPIVVEVV